MAKDKAAAAAELARAKKEHARVHAADKKAKAETARFLKANDRLHAARANVPWWKR